MTGVTVSIWHNVTRDQAGRHTAPLDGFTPGDPLVRVLTYQALPCGRPPEAIAEDAFAAFNDQPRDDETARLSRMYCQRRLRSLSFPGDLVSVGEAALIVERADWAPLRGDIRESHVSEPGSRPFLPPDCGPRLSRSEWCQAETGPARPVVGRRPTPPEDGRPQEAT